VTAIELPPDAPGPWAAVRELVELLPAEWILIGGLMVQLHAVERGVTDVRATVDVDLLGQARPPGALQAMDAALTRAGFEAAPADFDGYAYRYVRGAVIVDVLAPDGLNPAPTLDGSRKASVCLAARRPSLGPRASSSASANTASPFPVLPCSALC
jgi:hypothetical protein